MSITLRVIDRENWREALSLNVGPAQLEYLADVDPPAAIALAKAYVRPFGLPTVPYAIYAGQLMVGFFNLTYEPGRGDNYWIFHFFIDERYQGRGFGKAALGQLRDLLKRDHPDCTGLKLTVNPKNKIAARMYVEFGFRPTGEDAFGEPVYLLEL